MATEPHRTLRERYELVSEVGRGGMGRVWRAHDTGLNRTVAVKEILLGPGLDEEERARVAARARREAQATAMGQHPNIVTVYDIVEDDGRPWIVMEFLSGTSLHRLVSEQGPLAPERAAAWGLDLLDALGTAHALGITHRDVKPENVMITASGRVVLTDFGIATIVDTAAVTQTAGVMGSPAYLAPERLASAPAGPAADLWSLGAALHHAVTGVSPFQRDGIPATLHAVINTDPPRALPGPLGETIQRLLVKDPAHRLNEAGCRALLTAAARGETAVPSAGPGPLPGPQPPAAPAPVPPTTHVTSVVAHPTGHQGHPQPQRTGYPTGPTGPTAPVSQPPVGVWAQNTFQAPPQQRRLAWPFVVLTLGLATLLVATTLLVVNPWGVGEDTVTAGADTTAPSSEEPSTPAEDAGPDTQESPSTASSDVPESPEDIETAADGNPTGPAMTWTQDDEGFALLVPDGWTRRVEGQSVYFGSPTHDSYLQIDRTPHPTDDEYEHVLDQDSTSQLPGYQRVQVEDVTSQTLFQSAADWEFTWDQDGVTRHLLARNIAVTSGDHYTVLFAADEGMWVQQTNWREYAVNSFDPF